MFIMLPCSQRALILVPTYEKFRRDCRGLVVAMASVYIVCVQISSFMLRSVHRVSDLQKNPVRISKDEADEQQAHSMIPKTERYTDTLKQALTRQRQKV